MKKHNYGFTLAEVLITLVIIGVIAAMTIPTLMNKTNEQELVVATKKAYSILSQAWQRMVAENGEIYPQNLGSSEEEVTKNLGDMFAAQLNVHKNCGMGTDGDCWAKKIYCLDNYKIDYDSDYNFAYNGSNSSYKIRLNDGMSLVLRVRTMPAGKYDDFNIDGSNNSYLKNVMGYIEVDVNGDKGPSAMGIDIQMFYMTKYGIYPSGSPEDSWNIHDDCSNGDGGCTAWVIAKGNMDYLRKDVSW